MLQHFQSKFFNSLGEGFADEGLGRRLQLGQVREELGGEGGVDREQDVPGLPEGGELHGQVAVVVGGGEEGERLVPGRSHAGSPRNARGAGDGRRGIEVGEVGEWG